MGLSNMISSVFRRGGADAAVPHIDRAPPGAVWREVRPRRSEGRVKAELAETSGEVQTEHGSLHYAPGQHYLVHHADGAVAPVQKAIFEKTYRRCENGEYEKRTDIVLRYFSLSYPVIVETMEGARRAEPGDWIMEGVAGEIWPVAAADGPRKYEPV